MRPEDQRRRIGAELLDAALHEAAERASRRVTLWTAEDNQPAQHLFASRGFTATGRASRDARGTVMLHFETLPPAR